MNKSISSLFLSNSGDIVVFWNNGRIDTLLKDDKQTANLYLLIKSAMSTLKWDITEYENGIMYDK